MSYSRKSPYFGSLSHTTLLAKRRQCDENTIRYDKIRASYVGCNPLGQYALLQYQHVVGGRGRIYYVVDKEKIGEGGNRRN
jgi:hypothetical protein